MKKLILPLKENHLFSKAYTKGNCRVTKLCAVYILKNYKKNPDGTPMKTKLGITVNRKLGKACKRNRVKRLIREAYRQNCCHIRDGYIMIIAARAAAFAPQSRQTHKHGSILRGCLPLYSRDMFPRRDYHAGHFRQRAPTSDSQAGQQVPHTLPRDHMECCGEAHKVSADQTGHSSRRHP